MIARALIRLLACRGGHTAMEYGLMLGVAALVIITALTLMGETTAASLNQVAAAFN